jgi:hypothetical protein
MNTLGNWADDRIRNQRRTPYAMLIVTNGSLDIEGSQGHWGKFPDPFSQEFVQVLDRALKQVSPSTANDPWCLGYFIDSEKSWGDERSLALATIASNRDQPCKLVLLNYLKQKYIEIQNLNMAWQKRYSSWSDFLIQTELPDETLTKTDLDYFHQQICDKYFRECRDIFKRYCPNLLYLGSPFAWSNETAIRSAAEFCDVIGFNRYQIDLHSFKLPEGIDRPVIISEFHFGALDRGMFHSGLVPTDSQESRAKAYEHYVRSGLLHPQVIGTHWFQFGDQGTCGRGDGENYQIGLLSVTDTPYVETIASVRRIGYQMYEIRKEKKYVIKLSSQELYIGYEGKGERGCEVIVSNRKSIWQFELIEDDWFWIVNELGFALDVQGRLQPKQKLVLNDQKESETQKWSRPLSNQEIVSSNRQLGIEMSGRKQQNLVIGIINRNPNQQWVLQDSK